MPQKESVKMVMVATALLVCAPVFGAGPSFQPDARFEGSSLTGWHTLGQAPWRAQDGEIIGTPTEPAGGWLLLDRSYQDAAFYASFHCTEGCKTGVLFRAESAIQTRPAARSSSLRSFTTARVPAPVCWRQI